MNYCPPFVRKAYQLVSDADTNHIVSWTNNGSTFTIWDSHAFQLQILPKYFKHNNLCSFIRQLNTYGFHKINRGDGDELEFCHQNFVSWGENKLCLIKRKNAKKTVKENVEEPLSPENPGTQMQLATAIVNLVQRQEEAEKQLKYVQKELEQAKQVIDSLRSTPPTTYTQVNTGKRTLSSSNFAEPPIKVQKTEFVQQPTNFDIGFQTTPYDDPFQQTCSYENLPCNNNYWENFDFRTLLEL